MYGVAQRHHTVAVLETTKWTTVKQEIFACRKISRFLRNSGDSRNFPVANLPHFTVGVSSFYTVFTEWKSDISKPPKWLFKVTNLPQKMVQLTMCVTNVPKLSEIRWSAHCPSCQQQVVSASGLEYHTINSPLFCPLSLHTFVTCIANNPSLFIIFNPGLWIHDRLAGENIGVTFFKMVRFSIRNHRLKAKKPFYPEICENLLSRICLPREFAKFSCRENFLFYSILHT